MLFRSIHSRDKATRLFDAMICMDPLFPVYLTASIIISKRTEILNLEQDLSELYNLLNHIDMDSIDMESVLRKALELHRSIPSKRLWRSRSSALKYSRVPYFKSDFLDSTDLIQGITKCKDAKNTTKSYWATGQWVILFIVAGSIAFYMQDI